MCVCVWGFLYLCVGVCVSLSICVCMFLSVCVCVSQGSSSRDYCSSLLIAAAGPEAQQDTGNETIRYGAVMRSDHPWSSGCRRGRPASCKTMLLLLLGKKPTGRQRLCPKHCLSFFEEGITHSSDCGTVLYISDCEIHFIGAILDNVLQGLPVLYLSI